MSLRHVTTCHYHSQVRRRPNFSQKLVCIAALIGSFVYAIKAQKVEGTPPPFNAAVYRVGERLTYNISFAQFVAAGHAELFVAARGTYFNRDGIDHDMTSDPHPEHNACPEINQVGFLVPGQSRQTGNMNTVRTCGYHDHDNPANTAVQGTITIR